MALRVWLPLNGNINNKGLSGVVPVNHNCTIADGKIGQCYSFNGSTSYIDIGSPCNEIIKGYGQPFTLAFWIKSLEDGTRGILFSSFPNTGSLNFFSLEENSGGVTTNALRFDWKQDYDVYVPDMFDVNQWVHVSIAYDGDQNIHIYKNGVLKQTLVHQLEIIEAHTKNFWLGNDPRLGGTSFEGFMNDFRIYDECLSQKQIREISKGLVAHYKLEGTGANPNLVAGTYVPSTWTYDGCTQVIDTDSRVVAFTTTAANQRVYHPVSNVWFANQTYTYSFDAKASTDGATIDASRSLADFGPTHTLTTEWAHYTGQINSTMTATDGTLSIRGNINGVTYYVKNIKLENGNKETDWIPHTSDALYGTLGYSSAVTTDVSGNGYNATLVGSVDFNSDSPRYCGSTLFPTNTAYLKLPLITTTGFSNSFTIAWWSKISDMANRMAWGFGNGNRLNLYPTSSKLCCNTGDSANNPYMMGGSAVDYAQWNNNKWHHYVMVGDGSTNKLYIDGVLAGTATTYKGLDGTQIYLSGWDTGVNYKWVEGSLSDWRMYATPLTENDIKQLYKTCGYVDNKNNMYTFEFKEE